MLVDELDIFFPIKSLTFKTLFVSLTSLIINEYDAR